MSQPTLLQDRFDGGFKRDIPIDQLPKNALYDVEDCLPGLGVPLRKRGGWSYQGADLSTIYASATVPKRVFFAPFPDATDPTGRNFNEQVLAWDNNGRLIDVTNSADRGATTVPLHTPTFFRDLVIWGDGANTPKRYNGTAIAALGGSPPTTPRCSAVWKERVIFSGANTASSSAATIYFSAAGNAESWDTTNAVVRASDTIQGFATLPNALLVFHPGSVEKITGDTPPSATNVGNLALSPLYSSVGLYEPNALAVQDEAAYWADENGVYKTDGAALVDLTDRGGIKTYWQDQVAVSDAIAVGAWRGYVWVCLTSGDAEVVSLLCDIEKKSWWRFSNITARNFSTAYSSTDDLYFSNRETKFVGKLSSVFSPSASVKNDADGQAVTAYLKTGYFRLRGQGQKRLRNIYLGYDLRDAASDNPTIQITVDRLPDGGGGATTTPLLTETTGYVRNRVRVTSAVGNSTVMPGFAILVFHTGGAASDAAIYSIEADVSVREPSRR